MYRSGFSALWLALVFCSSAFGQTTPQFSLVDLGPTSVAGSGLPWQPIQATPNTSLPSAASTQGAACYGTNTNEIYAQYPGGEAVGSTCLTTPNSHAAMWTFIPGQFPKLTDLGVLPGALGSAGTGGPSAAAIDYNNEEEVVGVSDTRYSLANSASQQARHAFLYKNGEMTDLGAIAGPNYNSAASALNDSHEIVGSTSTLSSGNGSVLSRAFLYTNGTMYNLTFFLVGGPTALLTNALWIDCQGNIAAVGTPASGGTTATHSYLLIRQGAARTSCPD
jgi:probable HAF family extracellular repeat protein